MPKPIDSPIVDGATGNAPTPDAARASANGGQRTGKKHKTRTPRQPRTQLPDQLPVQEASHEVTAAWLTRALRLGTNPVAGAIRYGRHEDARTVIVLRSGLRITFDRCRDMFDARTLVRRVVIATGGQLPPYAYTDAVQIATAVVRLADLEADTDDREEAHEWADDFLAMVATNPANTVAIHGFMSAEERYRALVDLKNWRLAAEVPSWIPIAERSPIMFDQSTGLRYVRTSDFAAHVRGHHGVRVSWGALHSRMKEIGWRHLGEVQQRQPRGDRHVKLHLYEIPVSWGRAHEEIVEATSAEAAAN